MSRTRIGLAILLAGMISVGVAMIGQRWIDARGTDQVTIIRPSAPLQILPEFSLPDLHGDEVSSSEWSGKIVILNYWASWCPPCVREIPLFIQTQSTLGEAQVQVVGIAVDRLDDITQFIADYPLNYPILIANPAAMALSKRLGNRVEGLPFTVIFDQRGRRVFSRTGEITAAELASELDPLIKTKGS
ncbi:alkyl hydroperoxide reductase [Thiocapsa imhoffii]|uniref:Alkyl hydroperoxide reductase n=1 Tax=Thiocapsa imhoffii TaxID=382777 RepID=A0A9X0WFG7_9GAMM|nr:TlpA disulfide reductase family protein [Thiocapsa imhoffii]MBK1643726.1 alkyl hydroperoxide reductase [Thiocapsa imhoffii]